MPDPAGWAILIGGALVGSVIGGVAGFGAGVILLPLVAWTIGVRATVPVLTVAMLLGNISRAWWNRGEADRGVVIAFLAGAVPATAVGAILYAGVSADWLSRIIGAFMLGAVPFRRVLASSRLRLRLAHFPLVGGATGLLSALVVATGPVVTPFFLAYGLRRGAYIATEALCALTMHLTRGLVLARYALLTREAMVIGLVLGATMFAGSWMGRRLLERMPDKVFLAIIEALLVITGLQFLLFPR